MTSPQLVRLFETRRSLDQVTGRNVIRFPPPRDPWPYEAGAEPPKFLTKDKSDE